MSQQITLIGIIATTPQLHVSSAGVEFCTFRVACTERKFDAERKQWSDGDTNWFSAKLFRSLARHAAESFTKGERILCTGKLQIRPWETGERSGTNIDVEVDAIGHDVRWGTSRFTRSSDTASTPPGPAEGPTDTPAATGALETSTPSGGITAATADQEGAQGDGFLPDSHVESPMAS